MASMISKKKFLKTSKIYCILDKKIAKYPLAVLNKLKNTDIDIVQLRDKISPKSHILNESRRIKNSLKKTSIVFIINDYLDIAQKIDADGLHLGQNDLPLDMARRILGKNKIIGISCHSIEEALEAQEMGADYISIGPIFASATKPEYKPTGIRLLLKIRQKIGIPYFAIGGINLSNIGNILSIGEEKIALCSLLCKSKNPLPALEKLNQRLLKR